jgi:hypothetical protein
VGKGSRRRPRQISREEEDLRWKLWEGKLDEVQFELDRENLKRKDGDK